MEDKNSTPGALQLLPKGKKRTDRKESQLQSNTSPRRYKTESHLQQKTCLLKSHLFIPDIQNNVSFFCVKNSSGFCSSPSGLALRVVEASSMYSP